jgi:hypothetical protein
VPELMKRKTRLMKPNRLSPPTKRLACFFSIFLFLAHPCLGFDTDKVTHGLVKMEKNFLYLFDRKNHYKHAVKVEKDPLLPNRVYMKYDDDLHMWTYTKTSFKGKLTTPYEALRPGTVTTGGVIGAEFRLQRFLLNEDGTWVTTTDPEQYHVWLKTTPPQLKVFRYAPDPNAAERQFSTKTTAKPEKSK